jgi:hypothetical protein
VVANRSYFKENSDIHNINTRTKLNLHQPLANLSTYQKGAYYYGIKVFNRLPTQIRTCPQIEINLDVHWKAFYTLIHFITWMNTSIEISIKTSTTVCCGPDSSVSIATGYRLNGSGIESRWGWDFSHMSRPALGPTQPPVQWVLGISRG